MLIEFSGEIWYWRGPAPYYFVTIPEKQSANIKAISEIVSYGWGVIPVQARLGETTWKTSLIPKNGRYLVPLKDLIRTAENVNEGDTVSLRLEIQL